MRAIKILLVIFLGLAYIAGLFVPVMNHNAAHHANIALHMYLTGDYINLIDQGRDYLDKPHLLFWLAALAYHIFGISSFGYKIFSFVFVVVGIYSTYRLGKIAYGEKTGMYSALILCSAFAFILSVNDVRMDAMVVSCIAFATWQLFAYFFQQNKWALLFGALGLALGFSTKGMVAIALPVMATAFYFIQQNKFKAVFSVKWIPLALITIVFLFPVFYSFYLQYDLHPEKIVRGRSGNSGLQFLLFGQSVQRYTGEGWGSRSSDPFYLIHTFMWAFLPWCFIAYIALFKNIREWFRIKFRLTDKTDFAFTAVAFIIFLLVSFSRFKNAHYVNILFPYFSIVTAHFLLTVDRRYLKSIFWLQLITSILFIGLIIVINTWFFPVTNWLIAITAFFSLVLFIRTATNRKFDILSSAVWLSFAAMSFGYFLLNFNFYPKLLPYQSGHGLAKRIKEEKIDPRKIYYLQGGDKSYSMEFSLNTLVPVITVDSINNFPKPVYLFAGKNYLDTLKKHGIVFDTLINVSHYNVSTIKYKFLNPATRIQTFSPQYIIQIK